MKFRPLHDRVVLTRIDAEEKTAGGIIIPDTAKEKPQQGKVVAVGPGGRDENGASEFFTRFRRLSKSLAPRAFSAGLRALPSSSKREGS